MTNEPESAPKRQRPERVPSDILRERNTVRMVADYWGVSPDTVRRLADIGKLDAIRIGSAVRITREQVLAYEAANSTALAARKEKEQTDNFRRTLRPDAFEQGRRMAAKLRAEALQKAKDSTNRK